MPQLTIDDPKNMNLLGLMLGSLIERNLATPAGQAALRGLSGAVLIGAGPMRVALELGGDGVRVTREAPARVTAELRGSLATFAQVAVSDNLLGMLAPVVTGKLAVRGNPLVLLRLRALLRT